MISQRPKEDINFLFMSVWGTIPLGYYLPGCGVCIKSMADKWYSFQQLELELELELELVPELKGESGLIHVVILLSDPLVEFVIFTSTDMGSAGLVALVCGKSLFLPEDKVELLIYSTLI